MKSTERILIDSIEVTKEQNHYDLQKTYTLTVKVGERAVSSGLYIEVDALDVSDKWVDFYHRGARVGYLAVNTFVNASFDLYRRHYENLNGDIEIWHQIVMNLERNGLKNE